MKLNDRLNPGFLKLWFSIFWQLLGNPKFVGTITTFSVDKSASNQIWNTLQKNGSSTFETNKNWANKIKRAKLSFKIGALPISNKIQTLLKQTKEKNRGDF